LGLVVTFVAVSGGFIFVLTVLNDDMTETSYDVPIRVDNQNSANASVHVEIYGVNGTLYDEVNATIEPSTDRLVYTFERLSDTGKESFRVEVSTANETQSQEARMTKCYGSVLVTIDSDGDLGLTYSIC
jgi:hypothetical protein